LALSGLSPLGALATFVPVASGPSCTGPVGRVLAVRLSKTRARTAWSATAGAGSSPWWSRWPVRSSRPVRSFWAVRSSRVRPRAHVAMAVPGASAIAVGARLVGTSRATRSRPRRWTPSALSSLLAAPPVGAAVLAWPAPAARKLRGDGRGGGAVDQLYAGGIYGFRWPGRFDGDHCYAIDTELRLGPYHVAGLGRLVEQRAVQAPAWVQRARGTPCPGTVRPRACQLDLDAAGHGTNVQLRGPSANHTEWRS
jgi:hypothetical protein